MLAFGTAAQTHRRSSEDTMRGSFFRRVFRNLDRVTTPTTQRQDPHFGDVFNTQKACEMSNIDAVY
jgi:hypothetical protein